MDTVCRETFLWNNLSWCESPVHKLMFDVRELFLGQTVDLMPSQPDSIQPNPTPLHPFRSVSKEQELLELILRNLNTLIVLLLDRKFSSNCNLMRENQTFEFCLGSAFSYLERLPVLGATTALLQAGCAHLQLVAQLGHLLCTLNTGTPLCSQWADYSL